MIHIRALSSISLIMLGSWWGCATPPLPAPPPSPSAPFFRATMEETTQVAMFASELDTIALGCAPDNACDDQVYFSRALVSLFENREAARASFEHMLSLHPSSPFATSSALWLQLLKDDGLSVPSDDPQRHILTELTAQWVREWMARHLTVRVNDRRTPSLSASSDMQSLHKQLHERDRRIADLRAQLEALKVIDQEQVDKRKVRQPASLLPKIDNHW